MRRPRPRIVRLHWLVMRRAGEIVPEALSGRRNLTLPRLRRTRGSGTRSSYTRLRQSRGDRRHANDRSSSDQNARRLPRYGQERTLTPRTTARRRGLRAESIQTQSRLRIESYGLDRTGPTQSRAGTENKANMVPTLLFRKLESYSVPAPKDRIYHTCLPSLP